MRKLVILGLALIFLQPVYSQQSHPHILVTNADKAAILEKMNNQPWAQTSYNDMLKRLSSYVERHKSDPSWILSRYLMNRVPGKRYTDFYSDEDGTELIGYGGDAPFPTVRVTPHKRPPITKDGHTYKLPAIEELRANDTSMTMLLQSNAPGGKKEWVNPQTFVEAINGRFNQMVLDAAIVYWLTGNEAYAVFASDLLNQWARGAFYQNPIHGPCRTGFLSIQTLGDGRYETMTLAYDFLYDFLRRNKYELSYYQPVFEKIAHTMTFRGYWNNNWFAAQTPAMIFAALSLEDNARRDFYLDFYLNRDTINGACGHLALPSVVSKWLTPDGHWKEPGGYHNFPVSSLLLSAVAMEKNGYAIFEKFPALFEASYVMLKYSFPNYTASSFGDTGVPSQSGECLEIGIAMAEKYKNPILPQLISAMDVLIKNQGYRRESADFTGLLCYLPEIPPAGANRYAWPRSGALDFARCYVQRNGMDRINGLMYVVQGASYNHNHANGMSVELYGAGHVMGIDPGKGVTYEAPMHVDYYAQWAAHNTVVAGAKSASVPYFRGGGGMKKMGQIEPEAMEPLAGAEAVSESCSFTDTRYTDISTGAKQQRTLAIIRTSDTSGYYVDIYRSDHPESNEYVYHNIGNSVTLLTDARKPVAVKKAAFPVSKVPRDPPGFRMMQDFQTTGKRSTGLVALFEVKDQPRSRFMQAIFPGETGRAFFTAKAPPSPTAPQRFRSLPTPALICRQEGEAWTHPFVAVYEPFTGLNGFTVRAVEQMTEEDRSNFTALKVVNKGGSEQLILQSLNKDQLYTKRDVRFLGNFGVIGLEQNRVSYLYLGHGTELAFGNYGLKVLDSSSSANLVVNGNSLSISCNQETIVSIKGIRASRVSLSGPTGTRNLVYEEEENEITFLVPAVKNATITITRR